MPGIGISLVSTVNMADVTKKTLEAFELGMIDTGRAILGDAFEESKTLAVSANGRTYVAWRTGNNARSLGIAVSPTGNSFYGPLHTMDGGTSGSQGIPGASSKGPQVAIASSSGYGLWVHEGTSRYPGLPYLLNALFMNEGTLAKKVGERVAAAGY